jgi:hypothetical protein
MLEYLIWANLPRAAIVHHLPLTDLVVLYDTDSNVSHLLSLEKFVAGRKTQTLSAQLRERHIVLDIHSASAMGRIAKLFGLDGSIKIKHVEEFVAELLHGWSVYASMDVDIQRVAMAFARSLGSRVHEVKEVTDAFKKGINASNEMIAYFAKRRPTTRCVRTI